MVSAAAPRMANRLGVDRRACFAGDVPNPRSQSYRARGDTFWFFTKWCEVFGLPCRGADHGSDGSGRDIPPVGRSVRRGRYYASGDDPDSSPRLSAILLACTIRGRLPRPLHQRGKKFALATPKRWRARRLFCARQLNECRPCRVLVPDSRRGGQPARVPAQNPPGSTRSS